MPFFKKYDAFVKLYNEGRLIKFIKRDLKITDSQYRRLYHKAVTNEDITPRRVIQRNYSQNAKYYQKTKNGNFKVVKTVNGVTKHFGTYKTEEQVKLAVELLKSLNWDINYSWSVKAQVLEEFGGNLNAKK